MMIESILLIGRQAVNLYGFLGGVAKTSEHDRTKQGKMRHRLSKLLKTNDDGEHEALEMLRTELRYTIQDVANGVPAHMLGQVAQAADGKAMESITYSPESMKKELGEFKYDASEKDALFRFFRARLAAPDTSGVQAEAIYRVAGLFPNMLRALEAAQKPVGAKEPGFTEPPPEELHGGTSKEDPDAPGVDG